MYVTLNQLENLYKSLKFKNCFKYTTERFPNLSDHEVQDVAGWILPLQGKELNVIQVHLIDFKKQVSDIRDEQKNLKTAVNSTN